MRFSLNTIQVLIIVAALQAVLVVQNASSLTLEAAVIAGLIFAGIHIVALSVMLCCSRYSDLAVVGGWRVAVAAGVFVLAPQAAAKWLINPG